VNSAETPVVLLCLPGACEGSLACSTCHVIVMVCQSMHKGFSQLRQL